MHNKADIQTEQAWAFLVSKICFLVEFSLDIEQLYIITFTKKESNLVEQPFPWNVVVYCCKFKK